MVRPATPGTVIVLAATIVLVMVSISTPIVKSIYFLSANITVSVASVNIKGNVNLGVFGYCVTGIGTKAVCQGPQLGYELSSNEIFGNTTNINLPNSLIKWLTYALIIHPIAAALGALSVILGIVSHFREFSRGLAATWVASIASTIAMLAFIFDIVLFSIARSRINAVQQSGVAINATLGNGVWLTLVGFILMFVSGCSFGFGHRCISRRPRQDEKDRMRPRVDGSYAAAARKDAEDLEQAEKARRNGNGSGLPAFPEEEMPLTSLPKNNMSVESVSGDQLHHGEQSIAGVGTGYGRGPGMESQHAQPGYGSRSNTPRRRDVYDPQTYADGQDRRQPSRAADRAEPFTSMYDQPNRTGAATPGFAGHAADTVAAPYYPGAGQGRAQRQGSTSTVIGGPRVQMPQQAYSVMPTPYPAVVQPTPVYPNGAAVPMRQLTSPSGYANHPDANLDAPANPYYVPDPARARTPMYPPAQNSSERLLNRVDTTTSAYPMPDYGHASAGQHNDQPRPWLPPISTSSPINVAQDAGQQQQQQGGFYESAAQARHRRSVSDMPPQSASGRSRRTQHQHQYSQPDATAYGGMDDAGQDYDRRFSSHPAVQQQQQPLTAGAAVSPSYELYEAYYAQSPATARGQQQHDQSMPYAGHQQQQTNYAPTYATHDPYPSHGPR